MDCFLLIERKNSIISFTPLITLKIIKSKKKTHMLYCLQEPVFSCSTADIKDISVEITKHITNKSLGYYHNSIERENTADKLILSCYE